LVLRILTEHSRTDLRLDGLDSRENPLAAVAPRVSVPQLDRLEDPGRGAGRNSRAAERAGIELDLDLERRIATRVENLLRTHVTDRHLSSLRHSLFCTDESSSLPSPHRGGYGSSLRRMSLTGRG